MKKNYIGSIAGFFTGIALITSFYFFDFYLFINQGNLGSCIIVGLLFILLGFGRFYRVNSLYENGEQEIVLFITGLLIAELYFSAIKHLSDGFLYTATISYIAGMLLTRIPRFNSPVNEE